MQISANLKLNVNLRFFVPLFKSTIGIIFSILFKALNYQIANKINLYSVCISFNLKLKIKNLISQLPWINLTLYLPDQIYNSSYCQSYNSYNISSENLVLDQLIIPKL